MATDEDQYTHTLAALTAGGRHALSIKDGAKALDIGVATIWKFISQGKIRVVRLGKRTIIPVEEIARLLTQGA